MVKFDLNKDLDIQILPEFLKVSGGGIDFSQSIYKYHPNLKSISKEDFVLLKEFVEVFYRDHLKELQSKVNLFQTEWNYIENRFIKECENIFNDNSLRSHEYKGYLSILPCNPRFLDKNMFQIFHLENSSLGVTSHELLHFLFYSYTSNKLSTITKGLNPNDGIWWDVSEIFNNTVLSSTEFVNILGSNKEVPYPNHLKYLQRSKELFDIKKDIETYIKDLFKLIQEAK